MIDVSPVDALRGARDWARVLGIECALTHHQRFLEAPGADIVRGEDAEPDMVMVVVVPVDKLLQPAATVKHPGERTGVALSAEHAPGEPWKPICEGYTAAA